MPGKAGDYWRLAIMPDFANGFADGLDGAGFAIEVTYMLGRQKIRQQALTLYTEWEYNPLPWSIYTSVQDARMSGPVD